MNPQIFWNERFAEPELVYGEAPNVWMKTCLDIRPPGRILFPAEGQGRNAIYAARLGWQVDAFDFSVTAQQRAMQQAKQLDVTINYQVHTVQEYHIPEQGYDAVGLCYVHLPLEVRTPFYEKLIQSLKPGGELFLEAFTHTQLAYASGGPRSEQLLFTADIIAREFTGLETIYLMEMDTILEEGAYHKGAAHVVRYVGRKSH